MSDFIPAFHIKLADAVEKVTEKLFGSRYFDNILSEAELGFLEPTRSGSIKPDFSSQPEDNRGLLQRHIKRHQQLERAWQRMRTALILDETWANGLSAVPGGGLRRIPDYAWADAENTAPPKVLAWFDGVQLREAIVFVEEKTLIEFVDRLLPEKGTTSQAALDNGTQSSPTMKAENNCWRWLTAEMAASPEKRPRTKPVFFEEAKQKFGVGINAFNRAWTRSLLDTGAKWNAPGAPKRNPDT